MKRFNKILVILAGFTLFSCVLCACSKNEDGQTKIATVDDASVIDIGDDTDMDEIATDTEAVIAPVDVTTTESDTEAENTTEDVSVDEDGFVSFKGVTILLPEGYEYSADNSSIDAACFVNKDIEAVFVLCVDADNTTYNQSNIEAVFDSQIQAIYGDFVTHAPKSFRDMEGIEWVLDDENEGTKGRAFVVIDGTMMIYVEFFAYGDHIADYEAVMNSLSY